MPEIEMPQGRYLSLSGMIRARTGGQTRALLMRNRILTQRAGIETTLTTFDPDPVYPEVRSSLEAQGQLVPGMSLLNIFEWYRDRADDDPPLEPPAGSLVEPAGLLRRDEHHPDGTVYRTTYLNGRSGDPTTQDYRRPDGSVYLRTPAGPSAESSPATRWILADHDGRPTHSWARQNGWHRHWLRTLAGDAERVFVISDSRFELAYVVPMRDPRFHVMHLMHNTHTIRERRWNSPLAAHYEPLLSSIQDVDGLVTLTERQREDVRDRCGATNNLFVVPNPVDLPTLPDTMPPRERARFAVVSRLERQKRLDQAVRAFALVLEQEPDARLDIYGDGNLEGQLRELIEELDVGHRVTLCGHDPGARENLLTATAFVMTSIYEGYPLAPLESMSRGCPVVSFDIKYGPREQVVDGVNGFLTEPDDLEAFADRLVQLIRSPDLVEQMSKAALVTAEQHDYRAFLRDWRSVIDTVVAQKADRVRFEAVDLEVHRLGPATRGRLADRLLRPQPWSRTFRTAPELELEATLRPRGKARPRTLGSIEIALDAVCDRTGGVASLPLEVRRDGRQFEVRSRFDVGEVFGRLGPDDVDVRLRLRMVWNNVGWETTLARPGTQRPPFELAYAADGELLLMRSVPGPRQDPGQDPGEVPRQDA